MGVKDRFNKAVQADPTIAYVLLDADCSPIWASPSLNRLVDLDMSAKDPLLSAVHPDDVGLCVEVFTVEKAGRANDTHSVDCRYELVVRMRGSGGMWRRVALRMLNLTHDPEVNGYLLQLTQANQELNAVAAFDLAATGASPADVITELLGALETGGTGNSLAAVFDHEGQCLAASPHAPIVAGDHRSDPRWQDVCGSQVDMVVPVDSGQSGDSFGVLETCSKFGELSPFTEALTRSVAGRIAIVLVGDAYRQSLVHSAAFDALTGLRNRWSLREEFRNLTPTASVSVYFVDIDRFKRINDTFGHEAGDAVLVEIGRRLTAACRATDFVARVGGDEFVVIQQMDNVLSSEYPPGPSLDECVDALAEALGGVVEFESFSIAVCCSVGGSSGLVADRRDLVSRADAAMYERKRRRQVQFTF